MLSFDCIVVGSGHAGSCAAICAAEILGAGKVLIVDKCPPEWVGGNGYFTAGAHRTVHAGLSDLVPLACNVTPTLASQIDVDPYSPQQFTKDIQRLSKGKSDPSLVQAVVENSRDTIEWLRRTVDVPFTLSFNRQAYIVDGRQKFWGGMALSVDQGGKGLIAAHQRALRKKGVEIWFECRALELKMQGDEVTGLVVEREGQNVVLTTPCVVLAAGGFEANKDMRWKYLGDGWEKARVRGTPYNTGDGFELSRAVGAKFTGDWQGCHSTAWDANSPANSGERLMTNQFTKSGYPLGIMVNLSGERFVDEGEDFRNYTYAKFGRAILNQPEGCAFQLWDGKMIPHLRNEEYAEGVVERIMADTVEELADILTMKGLADKKRLVLTVQEFNEAVRAHRKEHPEHHWDPSKKDGLSTQAFSTALLLPKSNWALAIDEPPFMAVKVACGITFTFGGLGIDSSTAGVLSQKTGAVIEGLYCTGEMVGGLFYENYPGGSGLTAGAVFGRKAGESAARRVHMVKK